MYLCIPFSDFPACMRVALCQPNSSYGTYASFHPRRDAILGAASQPRLDAIRVPHLTQGGMPLLVQPSLQFAWSCRRLIARCKHLRRYRDANTVCRCQDITPRVILAHRTNLGLGRVAQLSMVTVAHLRQCCVRRRWSILPLVRRCRDSCSNLYVV